jgi:hypothetical protein
MKSSIKTFLRGKNRYNPKTARLKNAMSLDEAVDDWGTGNVSGLSLGELWFTDVLDDGVAITYSVSLI